MDRPGGSSARRGPVRLVIAVVLVVATAGAAWGVRLWDEHRAEQRLETVVADAHRLRSAVLTMLPYPRGLAHTVLEQQGQEVSIVRRSAAVGTVRLSENVTVREWTAPPFSRSGWPFAFCVVHEDGPWASYHSSDGVVRRTGTDGRCAAPEIPGVNARYPCPHPRWRATRFDDGRTRVDVRWVLGRNWNVDLIRWIDVYDADGADGAARRVARISPYRPRQGFVAPASAGPRPELVFVASNGVERFDSVGCRTILVRPD